MDDDGGEGEALRELIKAELEKCADSDLLDLIYKLLVS